MIRECCRCGHEPVINSHGKIVDEHNCKYVLAVDALIDRAAARADRSFEFYKREHPVNKGNPGQFDWAFGGTPPDTRTDEDIWDGMYHRAMERLREEAGIPLRRGE